MGRNDRNERRFALLLGAIVVLGVAVRWIYIQEVAPHRQLFIDSYWYYFNAANIREGRGYLDIGQQFAALSAHPLPGPPKDTAYWPPLFSAWLAGVQILIGRGLSISLQAGCITGGATVLVTGLLGRSIAGKRVGALAAALVAVSPFAIAVDGSLMSETLYVPLALLALLLAQRARTHPTAPSWCALGAVIGLAALTRGDALFLVVVALIPAAVLAKVPLRHLVPRVALGVGVLALVLAPWVIRNAVEVGEPTISTISANGVFAAANCSQTYGGPGIGSWNRMCMERGRAKTLSEADYSAFLRSKGLDYAFGHVERWPLVGAARVARVWGIWDPKEATMREAQESRTLWWQRVAWPISIATFFVGLVGFWVLARQRRPIAMLVAPVVMTTLVALVTYGNTRFRAAAEPALLIGVAAAFLAAWHWIRSRGSGVVAAAGAQPST